MVNRNHNLVMRLLSRSTISMSLEKMSEKTIIFFAVVQGKIGLIWDVYKCISKKALIFREERIL